MENLGWILALIAVVAVINLIRYAYIKATKGGISGAINRTILKKDVQRGEAITRKVFRYKTNKAEAEIRAAINARLWNEENSFDRLFVIEDRPDFVRYAFYNNAATKKLDNATFKAEVNFEPELPGFSLLFVNWLQDADTMVNELALNEMERMKYRVDQAAARADDTVQAMIEEKG
jgi:hypothetical protein